MASTRSKNTPGNYALEQSSLSNARHYETYMGYNFHEQTCYAGQGLLPGRYPLQLFRDNCDVESELLGIGSTNLVTPRDPQYTGPQGQPPIRGLPVASIVPAPSKPILPEPLAVSANQRYHA